MTVSSTTGKSGPYNGNGVTVAFEYEFRILDETHITVIQSLGSGLEIILTLADYSVSGVGDSGGGSVVIGVAPAADETITIVRNTPFTQGMDLENQGAYYAEAIERAFDLAAMRDQQLAEGLSRAVQIPVSADAAEMDTLIEAVVRLGVSADEIDAVAGISGAVSAVAGMAASVAAVPDLTASAVESAANASASAAAANSSKATVTADKAIVAADKAIVAADKATVAADKAIVTADKATVLGYRDEVEADRADVQSDKSLTAGFADAAAAALSATIELKDAVYQYGEWSSRYIGEHAANPTNWNSASPLNPGTDPLIPGLAYYNSVVGEYRTYSGSAWASGSGDTTDFAKKSLNGLDYTASTFRTNLDLYSVAQIDAFAMKLTGAQTVAGIKTFSSAPVVPNSSFTLGKLANGTALSIVGVAGNAAAAYADIVAGTDGHVLRRSGTSIGFGTILAAAISDFSAAVAGVDPQLSSLLRQNSKSAAYTLLLTDGGKHILHPSADTTARVFTIPSNASVAFPVGTTLTFVNQNAAGVVTIAITSDTMRLAGAGTTGSRTLSANGIATALKIAATEWIISGTGLS